ncbi:MAG: chromosome segregation protein SMC [Piscinibacter sp.]|uniref:chromosome segregation protein SMC n=1 Tax=Piscinibacter sp. TaxID=1903157 RepID=UPI001B7A1EA4|nr:chromosome segregation protein SMC [Piscinibacter sp.]MBP5989168.1 chromosome segregation protein SMC [Piscinibacter sp.]MBP6026752.1 chromosome segregation protein SMC [Piscinibacter sp.]
MRLNSIKLSGFKSFAEPTNFQLPGQLVGVVGPNGCGKSNIMDAVRWVLGESKASELRGESMQDVIFNGSGNRKPASRSSVELVFDNADARAGGQWNQFAEIAVKRVLTRDGTSSYYINNQPVRRRDVQDVFLGTGLGPRAYAIIGQGTISRIIESKPEELRLFLEEAAGVSKYKERRRETENRLKDTRENLTRVEDILRELTTNLDKLEKQAEVATQYRGLQQSGELKLHQLWFLKHRDAASEEERVKKAHLEATNALEARMAELRHGEAELETIRQAHYAASDELHGAQGLLAEAALEVSRLEERIRYVVEGRARVEQRLVELKASSEQWAQRQREAEDELGQIAEQIAAAEEQGEVLAAQAEEHSGNLPNFEDAVRAAQGRSNEQRNVVAQVQQQIQLLAAESRNIDEQRRQFNARRERLAGEKQQLAAPDTERLAELKTSFAAAEESQGLADARLHELQEQVPALDEERRAKQDQVNAEAGKLADLSARLEALRALQEKVQTEGKLKPWLARHGLDGLQGLWTKVHIEAGWETALEAALRERLNALEVGRVETVRAFADDAPPAKLAFYTPPQAAIANTHQTLPRLSELLRLGDAGLKALLNDWLEGVYTAASIDEALAARGKLTHGEVIMTREGHQISQFAVAFYAPDSEQAGMLARAQEIENLERQLRAQALIADEARSALVRSEAAYTEASQRLATVRRDAAEAQTRAHQLQVELLRLSQLAEQTSTRRAQLDEELAELDAQLEDLNERRATGEAKFEELDMQLATTQERHAELDEGVITAERKLAEAREQLRALERQSQEAQFHARSLAARRGELQRGIETALQQVAGNEASLQQLGEELEKLTDAAAQAGLQTALALKLEREAALGAKRSEYDDLTLRMRRSEEQRLSHEQSLEPLRERITKLQLEEQAAQLGGAQYLEQLSAAQVDLEALAKNIEEGGVKLYGLQGEIDRINREINALGAVNLAALDELTAARERKTFLDAQNADLTDAITTLEDAIHKIDLETRDLLGSTFNQVNEHFGRMFPSLFGGGQAKLVMTGDEILDAGVQVMAQPPGKKNSTIHLLSGGEKALTAIALVFAIFQLNPAPFCLLDEVDAPLDDANTERYAKLVKEMAAGTQFLFISHNKIAMEMAEQLIGVTMQEQGVSRIVAVDMEAAVSMAEAA